MADDSAAGTTVKQTLLSAAIAGLVALAVLVVLSLANVGSDTVQAVVAIALGVVVAQLYERRLV